jgi:hypothetical protein
MLRAEQAVELTDERTSTSRADLTLSAEASAPVDDPVEVRCWSAADWRIVREKNAWNDESEVASDLFGWADTSDSSIQMRLDQCNLLRRLARDDLLAWPRADQVDASDSLDTLAHETQHIVLPDADEAEAECAAGAGLARTALHLGATKAETARLVALYHSEIYPDLDDEYQREDCAE